MRIRIALAAAMLFAAACGGGSSTAAPKSDLSNVTLRFAEQFKGMSTQLQAAGELGNVPYKIEWSEFAAAAPQLQALGAGAADVALSGDAPAINAIGAGAPIKIVAATQPANQASWEGLSILVKKNSTIRSVADLKGKSISPTTQGSVSHQLVLAALAKNGLSTKDVKIVTLAPADARAAFNSGSIDAWATWDPYVATSQIQDDARILVTSQGLSPRYGFLEATESAIKDPAKHAAIQDLLGRLARAYAWTESHPTEWASTFSSAYNTPLPVAQLMMKRSASHFVPVDKSVSDGLQSIADLYSKNGLINQPVSVNKAFDRSFPTPTAQGVS